MSAPRAVLSQHALHSFRASPNNRSSTCTESRSVPRRRTLPRIFLCRFFHTRQLSRRLDFRLARQPLQPRDLLAQRPILRLQTRAPLQQPQRQTLERETREKINIEGRFGHEDSESRYDQNRNQM